MLVKAAVVKTQARRVLSRPRTLLPTVVVFLTLCLLGLMHHNGQLKQRLSFLNGGQSLDRNPDERRAKELGAERALFEEEYRQLKSQPGFKAIYGNTLETLIDQDVRSTSDVGQLGSVSNTTTVNFTKAKPVIFNPYPKYNSLEWNAQHAAYVPCLGPNGKEVEDIRVFKGRPQNFPNPGFGSYNVLGLDRNLCFERETRLGQYGVSPVLNKDGTEIDWDNVNWGKLQDQCLEQNQARFATDGPKNEYVTTDETSSTDLKRDLGGHGETGGDEHVMHTVRRFWRRPGKNGSQRRSDKPAAGTKRPSNETARLEQRTALLLRSFSGKTYTENDKQVIRSLVTELSLRTGGEFEVVLFVHIKDADQEIWTDEAYNAALEEHVPTEFRSIAVLWNERAVDRMYPNLSPKARKVHHGQFLSVQMFMQEFREFDFVWNWEMDSRIIGHNYDVLTKLGEFGKKTATERALGAQRAVLYPVLPW